MHTYIHICVYICTHTYTYTYTYTYTCVYISIYIYIYIYWLRIQGPDSEGIGLNTLPENPRGHLRVYYSQVSICMTHTFNLFHNNVYYLTRPIRIRTHNSTHKRE